MMQAGWLVAVGLLAALTLGAATAGAAQETPRTLPGTRPLTWEGDLAARMVAGIDLNLTRETEASVRSRVALWRRDVSAPAAYERSVAPNRERFRRFTGAVDPRVAFTDLEPVATLSRPAEIATGRGYRVLAVRWPVFPGVHGEGLLLEPERPTASVVALPDCDWTPEALIGLVDGVPPEAQFARRLAESGCRVLIPTLVDRADTFSGTPLVRFTNQPHREYVYRGAFQLGRHIIGYEVQKALAGVDWLKARAAEHKVGVYGYGEGGLLALYAGAVDPRVDLTVVSGYFGPRERVWSEPIYRNVWSLLREFGDAEIASLVAPRALIVEHAAAPAVTGPPPARQGRTGAAPGAITTPSRAEVEAELTRLGELTRGLDFTPALTVSEGDLPGNEATLAETLRVLGAGPLARSGPAPRGEAPDASARQRRQVEELVAHNMRLLAEAEYRRTEFWAAADRASVEKWTETTRAYREHFWDETIGRLPAPSLPANPRSRLIYDEPAYAGYEVVLDVWPDVFAYGILLLPKDLKPGEKRPVVVCQHGLEGRPQDLVDSKVDHPAYHHYGATLAQRGFVVFAPQNLYIGENRFRVLQRKLNPLKKSLFSVMARQHERILEWLKGQAYVDPARIAFYGLSYGGKSAMRLPAMLEDYCLSICSADYNEWIWKNASYRSRYSYIFTGEYEIFEWDLGNTFNYAEMSWLIFPRPFMVERGHDDGVAPDEWVAYEWGKTFQRYNRLGLADRARIEFFNGPHTIHGKGTFEFLHKHLSWPAPAAPAAE